MWKPWQGYSLRPIRGQCNVLTWNRPASRVNDDDGAENGKLEFVPSLIRFPGINPGINTPHSQLLDDNLQLLDENCLSSTSLMAC